MATTILTSFEEQGLANEMKEWNTRALLGGVQGLLWRFIPTIPASQKWSRSTDKLLSHIFGSENPCFVQVALVLYELESKLLKGGYTVEYYTAY